MERTSTWKSLACSHTLALPHLSLMVEGKEKIFKKVIQKEKILTHSLCSLCLLNHVLQKTGDLPNCAATPTDKLTTRGSGQG